MKKISKCLTVRLGESLDQNLDPELRGRIIGVKSQMDNSIIFIE